MKIDVFNQEGKAVGQTLLPKEIFGVKLNPDLVHQVMVAQMANRRQGSAHAKDRSEVRGGGRKPWRQKGTGRARHGSIRSPLWRGGGVTFGPRKERVFKKKINQKMRRKALFMVLSEKAKNNFVILLEKISVGEPKTKLMGHLLEKFPCKEKSVLIALPEADKNIVLASRNLERVRVMPVKDLNVLGLLQFKYLIMPKSALAVIKKTFVR
jgi:large subunit ribosomal protein L4